MKRISFDNYDAGHIYEMIIEHLCISEKEGICGTCELLDKRFKKFLGAYKVGQIRKIIKENGYCNKLK